MPWIVLAIFSVVCVAKEPMSDEDSIALADWERKSPFFGTWREESPQVFDVDTEDNYLKYPATRYFHSSVLDAEKRRMVITHGYQFNKFRTQAQWMSDTWAFDFDTQQWELLHPGHANCPSPRFGHSTVVLGRQMYLFGGIASLGDEQNIPFDQLEGGDLWVFDLDHHTWTQLHANLPNGQGPHPRYLHGATIITDNNTDELMVIVGGLVQGMDDIQPDTWFYDFQTGNWTRGPDVPMDAAGLYGATVTGVADKAYLFGGAARSPRSLFNALWVYNHGEGWKRIVPNQQLNTIPIKRNYHSTIYIKDHPLIKESLLMFAGTDCMSNCVCNEDVWILDLATYVWRPVQMYNSIATRMRQTIVFFENKLYTFGGESFKPYMYHNSVLSLSINSSHKEL